MSKSYKKVPITGITKSSSDKWYKKYLHRSERVKLRKELSSGNFEVDFDLIEYNDWNTPKDGKRYWLPDDIQKMPELIRK